MPSQAGVQSVCVSEPAWSRPHRRSCSRSAANAYTSRARSCSTTPCASPRSRSSPRTVAGTTTCPQRGARTTPNRSAPTRQSQLTKTVRRIPALLRSRQQSMASPALSPHLVLDKESLPVCNLWHETLEPDSPDAACARGSRTLQSHCDTVRVRDGWIALGREVCTRFDLVDARETVQPAGCLKVLDITGHVGSPYYW